MSKFRIDLVEGQTIKIGDSFVTMEHKSGKRTRITIEADDSTAIEIINYPGKSQDCNNVMRKSASEKVKTHGENNYRVE